MYTLHNITGVHAAYHHEWTVCISRLHIRYTTGIHYTIYHWCTFYIPRVYAVHNASMYTLYITGALYDNDGWTICISRVHILLNTGVHCTFGKPAVNTLNNARGCTLYICIPRVYSVHSEYHGCTAEYYGWRLSVPRVYILNTTVVHSAYHVCTLETSTHITGV